MVVIENISEKVKILLENYKFNADTLAKYEEADLKPSAFLEMLLSYHHLSKITIAKMADVEVGDIEKMLCSPPVEVDAETKYKIAAAAMSLRFFLKDCEPSIEE